MTERLAHIAARSNGPVRVTRPVHYPSDMLDIGPPDEDDVPIEDHRCPCGTISYGPPGQRCPTCHRSHAVEDKAPSTMREVSNLVASVRESVDQYETSLIGELRARVTILEDAVFEKDGAFAALREITKGRASRTVVARIDDRLQRLEGFWDKLNPPPDYAFKESLQRIRELEKWREFGEESVHWLWQQLSVAEQERYRGITVNDLLYPVPAPRGVLARFMNRLRAAWRAFWA